jgi:hypothetical protein
LHHIWEDSSERAKLYAKVRGVSPDTSHFLAPDTELGFPEEYSSSTANRDLATLIRTGHEKEIRFFIDAVMAFARHEAYQYINLDDFYTLTA